MSSPISSQALIEQRSRLQPLKLNFASESLEASHSEAINTDHRLRLAIKKALAADEVEISQTSSQLKAQKGQLFVPHPQKAKFHQRIPALNHIPLFYAKLDTEIASNAEIKTLSPIEKAIASTRLIAKRFIDADTNLSLYGSNEKGNPAFHQQLKPFREIRGEAATATIGKYRGNYINALYQHILKSVDFSHGNLPVTIFLVRPGRSLNTQDATINYLSLAAQTEVISSLTALAKKDGKAKLIQFSDDLQVPVISRTARSNASPLGRIVQQGFYDTSQVRKGDLVVIADDHSQAGATILSMASALEAKGAHVLGAITPTVHPFSRQLKMSPDTEKLLYQTLKQWDPGKELSKTLKSFGMPLETLTDTEALILMAYAIDAQDINAMKQFQALEQKLYAGTSVAEGESDSLKPILKLPSMPVKQLIEKMFLEASANRNVTHPISLQTAHILDWDDFLRDEKEMNYRLMHNAIAVSANRYGHKYPFLKDLDNALKAKRSHYQPGQAMPLLTMTPRQFAQTTIQNTKFLKRDAIDDLLKHLDALNPGLQQQFEDLSFPNSMPPAQKKQLINNILWHEFRRQYQAAIHPQTPNHLLNPARTTFDLPFKQVKPDFMENANLLLERLRRPENFIALISNRLQGDLDKEINNMGLAHYFDSVQGTPEYLVIESGKEPTLRHPQFKKPDPFRLNQLKEKHRILDQVKKWHFWGDTSKDITQAIPAFSQTASRMQGTLVNPSKKEQADARQQIQQAGLPYRFKVRTLDSL